MTQEDKFRKSAKVFLKRISEARQLFDDHMPSIGFAGEYLLRQSLHALIPKSYGVCQGFVTHDEKISRQCDIIIYKKGKGSVQKAYGELKIINAENVAAVIEVKSSITKEKYYSTLNSFKQLSSLQVTNCFLFVYGMLSRKKLSNWLSCYKSSNICIEQDSVANSSYLYDWSDMDWLPISVLTLESNKYFKLVQLSANNGDWVGYTSFIIIDSEDARVNCLQEFFSDIAHICKGETSIDMQCYSIEDGIALFRF